MSNLLKLLFNRVFIVLLLLALQAALLILVLQEAAEYYLVLNIIFMFVSIIYALKLLIGFI